MFDHAELVFTTLNHTTTWSLHLIVIHDGQSTTGFRMTLMNLHSIGWSSSFKIHKLSGYVCSSWDSLSLAARQWVFNRARPLVDVAVNPGVKDNAVWRGHHQALNWVSGLPRWTLIVSYRRVKECNVPPLRLKEPAWWSDLVKHTFPGKVHWSINAKDFLSSLPCATLTVCLCVEAPRNVTDFGGVD